MVNPFKYNKLYHYYLTWNDIGPDIERFLDYGCGKGEFVSKLKGKVSNLYGFDVDPEKINFVKSKFSHINLKKIKVKEKLPYKDNFFDAISMFHVLEHVDSEKMAINEIHRVLKPDGILYLASPYNGLFVWADTANLRYRFPRLHRWFLVLIRGKKEYESRFVNKNNIGMYGDCTASRTWHHHYNEEEVKRLLYKKFKIEKFYKFSIFHPFLLVLGNIWDYLFKSENKLIKRIVWWDNKINAGEFSYNMFVVARKK